MRPLSLLVFALLIASGCGCGSFGQTLDEAAELFVDGGEQRLRESPRPIRGAPRVLLIALDGVSEDQLRGALDDGDMPALARLLGERQGDTFAHAYLAPSVPAAFPAETSVGWATVFTGAPPAVTGVTGNEWFDRNERAVFAPVPLSVGTVEQTLQIWSDDLFGEVIDAPTLYEQADVRAHVSMAFVHRGADLLTPPDLDDLSDIVDGLFDRLFGGPNELYEELDQDTYEGFARGVDRYGLPDLQVAYFPGVDLVAHHSGRAEQRRYMRDEIDPFVGRILERYRNLDALDDTYVVIVSDHGHVETLPDDRNSLGGDDDADEPAALFDSLGYRLRPAEVGEDDEGDYDLVMVYNEAAASVYIADRSTCREAGDDCDWSRPPRLDEDVLPLARALHTAAHDTTNRIGGLGGAIDLILARASDPTGQTRPPFEVFDGIHLIPVADYLAANPRPDLVRFAERLEWLVDGPHSHRAGDMLLLARSGDERPIEERFYFGSPRVSGHGGASAGESSIAFLLAHTASTGAALRQRMERAVGTSPTQRDATPLVLNLLGR
jgi:predicted AlkP superfamily pyrophosphatase or phosphodiesterase